MLASTDMDLLASLLVIPLVLRRPLADKLRGVLGVLSGDEWEL